MRTIRALLPTMVAGFILSVVALPAFAQIRPATPPPPPPPVDVTDYSTGIGVVGGLTWSTIKGNADTNATVTPRPGLLAGVWFGGNFSGRLGFFGEVSYVMKGANESGGPGTIQLNYLDLQALARFSLGSRSREGVNYYVIAGPTLGFLINAKVDGEDATDGHKRVDLGIIGGGGVEVKGIGAEVRAGWGLLPIFEPGEGGEKVRNFSLQFVGKYRFK